MASPRYGLRLFEVSYHFTHEPKKIRTQWFNKCPSEAEAVKRFWTRMEEVEKQNRTVLLGVKEIDVDSFVPKQPV